MICVSCGISGDNFKVFNGDFLCSACEPKYDLEIKIKQLEAENAKLKVSGSMVERMALNQYSQAITGRIRELEAENASLKKQSLEWEKHALESDGELAKMKEVLVTETKYFHPETTKELATLKKQVEIAVEALEKISLARHDADIINQVWYWNVADKALQNLNEGKEAV